MATKNRKAVPAHLTLDSETFDRVSDNLLNAAEASLLPFLHHNKASEVANRLLERLGTHLITELQFIRTGKASDGLGEYTSAKTFREKFLQMGGIVR
jgi:hypothetical protein